MSWRGLATWVIETLLMLVMFAVVVFLSLVLPAMIEAGAFS